MTQQNIDTAEQVLSSLKAGLESFTPQERKAAAYVIDNSQMVGVSSIRDLAKNADVKPNTFVRLARAIGLSGFDELREPFKESIRSGQSNFPDRARWLQEMAKGGELNSLYAEMANSSLTSIFSS